MAKKNTLIKTKERRSVQEVAAFLRQLADRLERNEVALQRGEEEIKIEIPNRITFKVKAKEKIKKRKTKHQLKMTLKWTDNDKAENFVRVA
ncbi:MAG: amphi-Trp domain-containing protein [Anaerolineae bacterium]|jgi:amphi-Trp domain-containing protein|nr:amphi-Trp domain-containing protein [Anaerolineae bacterium]